MRKLLLAAPAVAAAVLGWGWWQARTHADVHVAVNDIARETPNQRWAALESGTVVLRDGAGQALAHGVVTGPLHLVEFSDAEAGDCARFERQAPFDAAARQAWAACYERRARWQATWARSVATASVSTRACRIDRAPVQVRRYDDWWLWWVPLPHVGGSTSAQYTFEATVDSAACKAVNPAP